MSLSIDELSSLYGLTGLNGVTQNSSAAQSKETASKVTDGDSYISTIADTDPDAAIPSENYNDLGRQMKAASQASEASDSQSAGGGGGSSDSDDDEDTETEIVTINGQTYLQTTTTDANGNTTVTRTAI